MRRAENLRAAGTGLVVFLLLTGALFLLTPSRAEQLRRRGAGSSRSTDPQGLARLYEALVAEGVATKRLQDDDATPADATVLIVEPASTPAPELVEDLARVVRGGEATLVAAGDAEQLRRLSLAFELGEIPDRTRVANPAGVSIRGAAVSIHTIGTGDASEPHLDPVLDDPEGMPLHAFEVVPLGFETLVAARGGEPIIVTRRFGHGLVVLVSEPALFENGYLEFHDNLEMVVTLLGGRGRVAFDDRWQARERGALRSTEMMSLVYGTGPGRALVWVALTGFFAAYLAGLFPGGPARRHRERRAPTAFVDALAELQLASRGGGHVAQHFQERFALHAARKLGLPPDVDRKVLAQRIAPRVEISAKELHLLMTRRVVARQVPDLVRRLDRVQRVLGR